MRLAVPMFALLMLVVCSCVAAEVVPIEGKLLLNGWDQTGDFFAFYMSGDSDTRTPIPFYCADADISPTGDRLAFWVGSAGGVDVWTSNFDGSNPFNVTAAAGLGGQNCPPRWSPDGTKLAFARSEPVPGLWPCEAGFQVWVVNADGTGAVDLSPPGFAGNPPIPTWLPNGYRVMFWWDTLGSVMIDIDGTDMEVVPVSGECSPDGSKVALSGHEFDVVEGEPGTWRQLWAGDLDGGNGEVLFEHFVPDSDILTYFELIGMEDPSFPDPFWNVVWWTGPVNVRWSPRGDRIAFIAMVPFNPLGPFYRYQEELWIYDFNTDTAVQVTDDDRDTRYLSWNGDNTLPEDPEVTVDNTTVTFSDVTGEGLTTIIREDDPPALPADYQFCGEYYNIDTTASYTPPITICMTYEDADVPGGNEAALCLLHYNEITEEYEDITISKDTEANIVCGQTDSLSAFGLAAMPIFGGFRPPINADGTSEWKAGRTIPVKFMMSDALGDPIANAVCHLFVTGPLLEAVGEGVLETAEAASADVGDTFRYDEEEGQYIYNLSTKGWAPGGYLLEVSVEGWPGFTPSVRIGLR